MTEFTANDDRALLKLLEVAADRALSDSSTSRSEVDSIHIGNMAAEIFNGRSGLSNAFVSKLGFVGSSVHRVENTSASGASAFNDAVAAVSSGQADVALAVGGEKMSEASTEDATEIIRQVTHADERQQGVTLPGMAGLAANYYLRETEATRHDLAKVAVKNHRNAKHNDFAQFNKNVEASDVLESPEIASPLRLYDCCPTSDGAAAVLLTTAETEVRVPASQSISGTHAVGDRMNPFRISSVENAAERAYQEAGIQPNDIDVASIHDAFTILEWIELEELGLAPEYKAWRLTREGETKRTGKMPVNPGGGLKARGHPLGATGLAQIVEMTWQLREQNHIGCRQVKNASTALTANVAGFGNNCVCTILEGPK
ncbi:thiolase family protein [Salinarchaeum sp. IM2453]|uniref:thiolase C-terminal domain-containing protein n=1 Tax=Salinarchaeum sp. IM2453 TaxID=2862870 RepID=UPI001C83A116|nr:thiolase family protein [Salinarchaeum sp. IM2453]